MKRINIGILLLALALPAAALAQASGSSGTPRPSAGTVEFPDRPFAVTRSLTGTIAEIKAEEHIIVVTEKNGRRHEFRINDKTKLKADPKLIKSSGGDKMADDQMAKDDRMADNKMVKDGDKMADDKMAKDDKMAGDKMVKGGDKIMRSSGKGGFTWDDLRPGRLVKVTYLAADHTATQVELRPAKK